MLKIAVGQCEGFDAAEVAAAVAAQCAAQLGGEPARAGLLLVSGQLDYGTVLATVRARFPGVPLAGASSSGDLSSVLGYSEDSVNLLLFASAELSISVGSARGIAEPGLAPAEIDARLDAALAAARAQRPADETLCLVFLDGMMPTAELVLERLRGRLAPGCAIFGGRAGAPVGHEYEGTAQLCNDEALTHSVSFLLFHGPLAYDFTISQSWIPVGVRQPVTAVSGPWVERIGDRTALDFYRYHLGGHTRPAFEFPLAVFDPRGQGDTKEFEEHFYLRVPLVADAETGRVLYGASVPLGAEVQITEAVRERMLEQTRISMEHAAARLRRQRPQLALVFSCAVRKQILGTQTAEELRLLRELLPPGVTLFGFYAFGEVAPLVRGGPSVLHNSTLVTLLLGTGGEASDETTPAVAAPESPAPASRPLMLLESARSLGAPVAATADPRLLARKLARAELYRRRLEESKDLNGTMLRTQNAELQHLNARLHAVNGQLAAEMARSDTLLHNILPHDVVEELKHTGAVEPVFFPSASVLFTDFKGFTQIAGRLTPAELIRELAFFFSAFDRIIERHGLEKLKTIGDAYMCAGGLPTPTSTHPIDAVAAAWEMQRFMADVLSERRRTAAPCWELRIGVNTGPLMAGVIGTKKFAYDIWGKTGNRPAQRRAARGVPSVCGTGARRVSQCAAPSCGGSWSSPGSWRCGTIWKRRSAMCPSHRMTTTISVLPAASQ